MQIVRLQRVIKVGPSLAVVVPVDVRRALGINRGDTVTIGIFEENTIVIRRLSDEEIKSLRPQQILYDDIK